MTVTITIPDELKARIAERAAAKGVTLEEYAQEVLERYAEMLTLRELFAPVRDQIKAAGVSDEELAIQIEEAVTEVRTRPRGCASSSGRLCRVRSEPHQPGGTRDLMR